MDKLIESFIKKWSTWFIFQPNKDELREAMRKEIEEIIKAAKEGK
jgi:hypothetical protein